MESLTGCNGYSSPLNWVEPIFEGLKRWKALVPGAGHKSRMNKGFASIGEKTIFPTQNFTSVSAGRNRDNLEKQVRLILHARF